MGKPFSVVALFVDVDGEVLSITRRGVDDDWGLIGGKVEASDEDAEAAIIREVLEETGVKVAREDLLHIYARYDSRKPDDKVCFCFFVKQYRNSPRAMENGFKVRWVPFEKLLEETNTFHVYNRGLYEHLQVNPLPGVSVRLPTDP